MAVVMPLRNIRMMLPDLKYDFSDALVTGVRIGPRREVIITILIVEWTGN